MLDAIEQKRTVPAFLEMDEKKLSGKFVRLPERSELNPEINEQLIVEFYKQIILKTKRLLFLLVFFFGKNTLICILF